MRTGQGAIGLGQCGPGDDFDSALLLEHLRETAFGLRDSGLIPIEKRKRNGCADDKCMAVDGRIAPVAGCD